MKNQFTSVRHRQSGNSIYFRTLKNIPFYYILLFRIIQQSREKHKKPQRTFQRTFQKPQKAFFLTQKR
jgi:hypothetical protein